MFKKRKFKYILFLFGVCYCFSAGASWSLLSFHRELEGYSIVEVGEVRKRHYYDPETLQRLEWFEFTSYGTVCFLFSDKNYQLTSSSDVSALLLKRVVGRREIVKIALLQTFGYSINVDVEDVKFLSCPELYPRW